MKTDKLTPEPTAARQSPKVITKFIHSRIGVNDAASPRYPVSAPSAVAKLGNTAGKTVSLLLELGHEVPSWLAIGQRKTRPAWLREAATANRMDTPTDGMPNPSKTERTPFPPCFTARAHLGQPPTAVHEFFLTYCALNKLHLAGTKSIVCIPYATLILTAGLRQLETLTSDNWDCPSSCNAPRRAPSCCGLGLMAAEVPLLLLSLNYPGLALPVQIPPVYR